MATQTLLVGLDAADKELIFHWAAAGRLPNLKTLLERSAWGTVSNPLGLFVGAVWPSFYTGVSPARHGRYCYAQLEPGSYRSRRISPDDVAHEPFWDALSRAGRRVAIVDVPKSSPSRELNGVQVVDWGTHDPDYGFSTWPETLAAELGDRFGQGLHKCDAMTRSGCEPDALRDHLIRRIETKERLSAHLLEQESWDLFVTVFSESHCAGHQFWHLHDPAHPRHDADVARRIGDPLLDVYTALDVAVGRLLQRVGPATQVFVLASHGMGPHYDGTFLLREILRRLEAGAVSRSRRWAGRALARSWQLLPPLARQAVRPLKKGVLAPVEHALPTLNTAASHKAFAVLNNDAYGAIRINLAGREPHGRVRPGAELEAVVRQLAEDLQAFVILPSGQPLVRRVIRTAEHYHGERLDALPDLLIEWNREAPISRVSSPKTGQISGRYRGSRSGDHKPEGLVLSCGPAVRPGPLAERVHVTDLAPTVAARLGVTLPTVDGRVVASLLPAA